MQNLPHPFSIKLSHKGANSVIGYLGTKMPFHIQPVVVMGQYSVILILGSALLSAGLVTHYVALSKLIISFVTIRHANVQFGIRNKNGTAFSNQIQTKSQRAFLQSISFAIHF